MNAGVWSHPTSLQRLSLSSAADDRTSSYHSTATATTAIATITAEDSPLKPFLSRHVPQQLSSNPRKLCYRHRPDFVKRRMPDDITLDQVQKVGRNSPAGTARTSQTQ
ncbi:hypothetical protein BC937DRAFT_87929 [Endogone sp. FLAS-F59071]|nr:hypothetical protein BC937DRAFT_87929 [Endogone sp. FLAS-F59071]|eukprot:RUS12433.1 hypothetical protein BC937DRAFT_87929 [Endogone sp. FLAS-F59071]